MKINQSTIEEIKSRTDIVDVIGDFLTLKRTGQHYKARSPFSDEKTPSFIVFPRNQNFKDFSSGKQGDAISFIMEYDGLSYVDAIKYLAQKYGVEIEEQEQTPEEVEKQNERESLFIILNFAKDFYKKNLFESEEGKSIGLSYFKERGFSDETINKFELGYSLDKWDTLEKAAISNQFSNDLLEKAGLIIRKEDKQYDRFRGRVIFPIHSITGKAIAFGARILTNQKNQPKYLNSPETEIYHKSNVLYGLYQSSRAIRQQDNCYLVEGYTDVISLHQYGVENVVSSSGTSLTENQIKLIQRHTSNITVLFDGDAAGMRASVRGIDMILQQGMDVKAVVFPDGEDPDSYSKRLGSLAFQEFLKDNATDFIHFKINLLQGEDSNDPISRANTINQIVASISKIPEPVKRAVYMKETSNLLKMDEQTLYAELNKILILDRKEKQKGTQRPTSEQVVEAIESTEVKKVDSLPKSNEYQEKEAIRILINYGFVNIENEHNLVDHYLEELKNVEFTNPIYKKIFELFKDESQKGNIVNEKYLLNHPDAEVKECVINLVSTKYEVSENWERYQIFVPKEEDVLSDSVYDNILRIKLHITEELIYSNKKKLKEEGNQEKELELLQIINELQKAKKEFATALKRVI